MNKHRLMFLCALLTVTLFSLHLLNKRLDHQEWSKADVTTILQTNPGDAEVDGKVRPFELGSGDFKSSIMSHPYPEVWLVFHIADAGNGRSSSGSIDRIVKVELNQQAQAILESHWKTELTFYYDSVFLTPTIESLSDEDRAKLRERSVELDRAFRKATFTTWNELKNVYIDAPDGKRKLRGREIVNQTKFLGNAAFDVIQQAKTLRAGAKQTIAIRTTNFNPLATAAIAPIELAHRPALLPRFLAVD